MESGDQEAGQLGGVLLKLYCGWFATRAWKFPSLFPGIHTYKGICT